MSAIALSLLFIPYSKKQNPPASGRVSQDLQSQATQVARKQVWRIEDETGIEAFTAQASDEVIKELERIQALRRFEEQLRDSKRNGEIPWVTSDTWMKDPNYYAQLSTSDLAKECFTVPESPIFGIEMSKYSDPKRGLLRLEIMHNGFSELLQRDDFAIGILSVYEVLNSRVVPGRERNDVMCAAWQLDSLTLLYNCSERFRSQIAGKEELLIELNISAIENFISYIEKSEKEEVPIYGEPVTLVHYVLALMKETLGENAANEVAESIAAEALLQLGQPSHSQNLDVLVQYLRIARKHLSKAMEDSPH